MSTIFKQIIDKKIKADIVHEDDLCLAFKDINAQAPVHILVIPKKEIPSMAEVTADDKSLLGHLMVKVHEIAKAQGLSDRGYRLVVNTKGDGGQTVDHLHIHILGGRRMGWPPGQGMTEVSLIEEFKNKVSDLQEVDIGDFRRRLSLYIDRLDEDLETAEGAGEKLPSPFSSDKKEELLLKMKNITLYENHSDMEVIREKILSLL